MQERSERNNEHEHKTEWDALCWLHIYGLSRRSQFSTTSTRCKEFLGPADKRMIDKVFVIWENFLTHAINFLNFAFETCACRIALPVVSIVLVYDIEDDKTKDWRSCGPRGTYVFILSVKQMSNGGDLAGVEAARNRGFGRYQRRNWTTLERLKGLFYYNTDGCTRFVVVEPSWYEPVPRGLFILPIQ